jgi:hypothetical protein
MKWRTGIRFRASREEMVPVERQVRAWRRAGRRMRGRLPNAAFRQIPTPPDLTPADRADGFTGVILSYGFGASQTEDADAVLSGQLAWERACRSWRVKTWQCRYIHFGRADHMRLRPGAPPRPRGFYFAKFRPGDRFIDWTVARFLNQLPAGDTGCGPEGIQLLTITHPHLAAMMNRREIPFMAFADYDVAPHGFNDFYDALQMFCSNATLGLGIGNVDRNYPLFGIPTLRF